MDGYEFFIDISPRKILMSILLIGYSVGGGNRKKGF